MQKLSEGKTSVTILSGKSRMILEKIRTKTKGFLKSKLKLGCFFRITWSTIGEHDSIPVRWVYYTCGNYFVGTCRRF